MLYKIIVDAKEDIEKFISKFGKENFDLFNREKDRLKNNNVSIDYTWHVKHTSPKEMSDMLIELSDYHDNYDLVYEDDRWKVIEPLDWQTAFKHGGGTRWCISGRWDGEDDTFNPDHTPDSEQAAYYFDDYLENEYDTYYFIFDKKTGEKYCYCPRHGSSEGDLFNADDEEIEYIKDFPNNIPGLEEMSDSPYVIYDGVLVNIDNSRLSIIGNDISIPEGVKILATHSVSDSELPPEAMVTVPSSVTEIKKEAFYDQFFSRLDLRALKSGTRLNLPIGSKIWMDISGLLLPEWMKNKYTTDQLFTHSKVTDLSNYRG